MNVFYKLFLYRCFALYQIIICRQIVTEGAPAVTSYSQFYCMQSESSRIGTRFQHGQQFVSCRFGKFGIIDGLVKFKHLHMFFKMLSQGTDQDLIRLGISKRPTGSLEVAHTLEE